MASACPQAPVNPGVPTAAKEKNPHAQRHSGSRCSRIITLGGGRGASLSKRCHRPLSSLRPTRAAANPSAPSRTTFSSQGRSHYSTVPFLFLLFHRHAPFLHPHPHALLTRVRNVCLETASLSRTAGECPGNTLLVQHPAYSLPIYLLTHSLWRTSVPHVP